jgi:hypothetical protein
LAALPPQPVRSHPRWLRQWMAAANSIAKGIIYFGVTPSALPLNADISQCDVG